MLDFSALLGFSRCGPGSWSATTSRTHRIETISTLLAIIPKWSGQVRRLFDDQFNSFIASKSLQPHTKLGVDWPSVTAVVREASHSSTMYATIAQCEFKSAMSIGSKKKKCKIMTEKISDSSLMRIYCHHVAASLAFRESRARSSVLSTNWQQLQLHEPHLLSCPIKNHFFRPRYSGNRIEQLGTPYKKGRPCSSCQQSCHSKKIRYGQPK
jgi:hypothetical protein